MCFSLQPHVAGSERELRLVSLRGADTISSIARAGDDGDLIMLWWTFAARSSLIMQTSLYSLGTGTVALSISHCDQQAQCKHWNTCSLSAPKT